MKNIAQTTTVAVSLARGEVEEFPKTPRQMKDHELLHSTKSLVAHEREITTKVLAVSK